MQVNLDEHVIDRFLDPVYQSISDRTPVPLGQLIARWLEEAPGTVENVRLADKCAAGGEIELDTGERKKIIKHIEGKIAAGLFGAVSFLLLPEEMADSDKAIFENRYARYHGDTMQ